MRYPYDIVATAAPGSIAVSIQFGEAQFGAGRGDAFEQASFSDALIVRSHVDEQVYLTYSARFTMSYLNVRDSVSIPNGQFVASSILLDAVTGNLPFQTTFLLGVVGTETVRSLVNSNGVVPFYGSVQLRAFDAFGGRRISAELMDVTATNRLGEEVPISCSWASVPEPSTA